MEKLLDYGLTGLVLLILFGGIGWFLRWMCNQFSAPKKDGEQGGLFYEWITAHSESARKIGEAFPLMVRTQDDLKTNLSVITDTQRLIVDGVKIISDGQNRAADAATGRQVSLLEHEEKLIRTLDQHAEESRPAMGAIESMAASVTSLREAGTHACIVAEKVLGKLGGLEEARPSLEKIRQILSEKEC